MLTLIKHGIGIVLLSIGFMLVASAIILGIGLVVEGLAGPKKDPEAKEKE